MKYLLLITMLGSLAAHATPGCGLTPKEFNKETKVKVVNTLICLNFNGTDSGSIIELIELRNGQRGYAFFNGGAFSSIQAISQGPICADINQRCSQ